MRLQLGLFVLLSVVFTVAKAECPVTCTIHPDKFMVDFKCEPGSEMQMTVIDDVSIEVENGKVKSIRGMVQNKYSTSGNKYISVFSTHKCSNRKSGYCITAKVKGPTIREGKTVNCKSY